MLIGVGCRAELAQRGVDGVPAAGAGVIVLDVVGLDALDVGDQGGFVRNEAVGRHDVGGDELGRDIVGVELADAKQGLRRLLVDEQLGGGLHRVNGSGTANML